MKKLSDASLTNSVHYLSPSEFIGICFSLSKEWFSFVEPIPDYETRFPGKIDSILEMPRQQSFGKDLYPTIYDKAACYFFFIIKNHPFLNGNKRIAIVTTYVFLRLNDIVLDAPDDKVYDFALSVSASQQDPKRL
jgi:death on curing protein